MRYASRDFYGVEDVAATPADYRGANEMFDWTRRVETALRVEHYATGVHDTTKIGRTYIDAVWDGTSYTLGGLSYGQDTSGVTYRGTSVTIDRSEPHRRRARGVHAGRRHACGELQARGLHACVPRRDGGLRSQRQHARCFLTTLTSTTVFRVKRFVGTVKSAAASQAVGDGDMRFLLHY
jgi:hypothetical protein